MSTLEHRMYPPRLLEHFQNPRNVGELEPPAIAVEASNPACGDILRLSASFAGGRIVEVRYKVRGCTASIPRRSKPCTRAPCSAPPRCARPRSSPKGAGCLRRRGLTPPPQSPAARVPPRCVDSENVRAAGADTFYAPMLTWFRWW